MMKNILSVLKAFLIMPIFFNISFAAAKEQSVPSLLSDTPKVCQLARDSVRDLRLDWENHHNNFAASSPYFTTIGFESFMAALEESKILEGISNKLYAMSFTATGPGKVTEAKKKYGGQNTRIAILPIERVTVDADDQSVHKEVFTLYLLIVDSAEPQNTEKMGILQWIALPTDAEPFEEQLTKVSNLMREWPNGKAYYSVGNIEDCINP